MTTEKYEELELENTLKNNILMSNAIVLLVSLCGLLSIPLIMIFAFV